MTPFAEYLAAIRKRLAQGDATEQTHRAALEHLLEAVGKGITATNEPKRIACGAPDFNITRHKVPLGHIETKDIGISLDDMERGKGANGEQFKRYRDALPNWILTDYLEFRWFVAGEKRLTVHLAESDTGGKVHALPEGEQQLAVLLDSFFTIPALTVGTAKELAQRMAGMTRNLRDLITATFAHGTPPDQEWLQNWLTSFREVLIPDLDEAKFADMFAQTLAYGLFAARIHTPTGKIFSREMAAFSLPKTNPFLRKLFAEFAGVDMPETFGWAVDDIVELLKHAPMDEVLKDFGKGKGKEDPVVHFYETFLAAYDPKMRELRGVYYTPEPVVSYIVRSIDHLLKTRFDRPKGLADENTLILDPATGTGTFLYFVVRQIYEQFASQKGAWDSYVSEHLLNRLFGFELLMAPYAIAHLKLGLELHETGYSFGSGQRLGVYLTNTLEEAAKKSEKLIAKWISDEADSAAHIKRDLPIMVVLGNPPYSGISANSGPWIENLMEDYKVTVREEERQIQRLSNDYVKFIRFAQWRLERTGHGILAFITDSGYLDGILFRDVRHVLLRTFPEVFILNLHGVAVRGAQNPKSDDENVFDITQGVAIGIFVKCAGEADQAKVHYYDMVGTRESKYHTLAESSIAETKWDQISPQPPAWRLIPTSSDATYESWPQFTAIIGTGKPKGDRDKRYGTGIKTRHDDFVVGWDAADAVRRVRRLADRSEPDHQLIRELKLCTTAHFNVSTARKRAERADISEHVAPITYRPFDRRYLVYLRDFVCEPKRETMRHLLHADNIAMAVLRRDRRELGAGFLAARGLIAKDMVSNLDDALVWPLYLYSESEQGEGQRELAIHALGTHSSRSHNLEPAFVGQLEKQLGLHFASDGAGDLQTTFGPEDVFDYMYAVFHSPTYRKRYAEFLKSDFPRLPLTSDRSLFVALTGKGSELVSLHLMESPKLDQLITTFPEKGSNLVEKVTYIAATQRVCINGIQYFQGVARDAWEFHIGGYQVLEKWLKDRKGRELTWDDTQHYQKVVVALKETIRLMGEIDAVIEAYGGWPLQ